MALLRVRRLISRPNRDRANPLRSAAQPRPRQPASFSRPNRDRAETASIIRRVRADPLRSSAIRHLIARRWSPLI